MAMFLKKNFTSCAVLHIARPIETASNKSQKQLERGQTTPGPSLNPRVDRAKFPGVLPIEKSEHDPAIYGQFCINHPPLYICTEGTRDWSHLSDA